MTIFAALVFWISFIISKDYRYSELFVVVLFVLIGFIAEFNPVAYNKNISQTVSTPIFVAAIFLFSPLSVVLIVAFSSFLSDALLKKPWYKTLYNATFRVVIYGIPSIIAWSFGLFSKAFSPRELAFVFFVLLIYVLMSTFLMGTLFSIVGSVRILDGWRKTLTVFSLYDLSLLPYGIILAWLWHTNFWLFLVGLLPLIAMQRSFALHAGLLNEQAETKRLADQQRRVQEAMTVLLSTKDIHAQLDRLLQHLMDVFPISRASVVLWDAYGHLERVVSRGVQAPELPLEQWSDKLRLVSERGRIVRLDQDYVTRVMQGRPVLLVPLKTPEDTVGCLVLVAESTLALTEEDEGLLGTFAGQAALAIYQSQLIDRLQTSQVRVVQSERLAAIGTLVAGVAHEFNNLLAGISGMAQLALMDGSPEEQRTALETVARTAQQGGSITRGLLMFSRQAEPKHELADVRNAVEPVLALFQAEFRRAHVTLVQHIEPVPLTICDVGMLAQCVINLVTNALDAMHPRGGTLTVTLGEHDGFIYLKISDTGCGIPEQIRDRIFEPFVSSKASADGRLHGGTGLGLSITYGVVKEHGGTIEVETAPNVGTTMTIRLPIRNSLEPADEAASARSRPLHMVVVDDEPLIAKSLHGLLMREGYIAEWYTEPLKALEAIRRTPVDVIFADLIMPEMDGVTLLERAREWAPNARRIVVTGQIDPRQLERVLALGVTAVIEKPFSLEKVRSVVAMLSAA
ncbi:hybrid sensor histidine kinase/response regulator [Kallotenue papyrolyticum]|uniref:hybrid sensor histidine kinase/response regulator n=1 Tax=Kallotenue papyrolyticum TaxID=1325125 RepID=UPI001377381A|nr:ATP-binding protein [Kallotenue papyrolyticum]